MLFKVINDVFQVYLFSLRILHYTTDHVSSIDTGEVFSLFTGICVQLINKLVNFIENLLLLCNMIRER